MFYDDTMSTMYATLYVKMHNEKTMISVQKHMYVRPRRKTVASSSVGQANVLARSGLGFVAASMGQC